MTQTLQIKDGPWISPDAGVRLVEASLLFGDAEVSAEMHAGDVEGAMFTARLGERVCRMDLGDIEQARYMLTRLREALPECGEVRFSPKDGGILLSELPAPLPLELVMGRLTANFKRDARISLLWGDGWRMVAGVAVWLGLPIELEAT